MVRCGASDSANVADQVGAGQRAGYPVVDGVAAGPFSSCYTSNQYRALQQFFKWWAEEEDRPDPMAGLHPPKVTEKLVPVFSSGELSKLEQACAGRGFAQRRDAAIIAVFRSTGIRLAELAGIRYDPQDTQRSDLDLWQREITVRGKNGKARIVKISYPAARPARAGPGPGGTGPQSARPGS